MYLMARLQYPLTGKTTMIHSHLQSVEVESPGQVTVTNNGIAKS
jgi:hypothetical protein